MKPYLLLSKLVIVLTVSTENNIPFLLCPLIQVFCSYRACYDDVMYLRCFLSSVCLLPSVIQVCFIILCIGKVPRFISVSYFVHLFISVEANAVSTLHEKYRN
jgi:hypothetical protein